MKQQLLVLFILTIQYAHAQFTDHHAIYVTTELSIGNYVGIDLNMNYVLNEKYSLKAGYSVAIRKPRSAPEDFHAGMTGLFGAIPFDRLEQYQFMAGRVYNLHSRKKIRINFALGVGYTTITRAENWDGGGAAWIGSNYSWEYEQHHAMSLIINPKIEFPFVRFYGFSISPMAQINHGNSYLGIGIGQMIGLLRKR